MAPMSLVKSNVNQGHQNDTARALWLRVVTTIHVIASVAVMFGVWWLSQHKVDAIARPRLSVVTRKVMILLGFVISILSFSNPVIICWSLGGSLLETITFHSLWDLIATTASCLAWLLFAITQLHIEGNRVFGLEVVSINLMGTTVYTFYTIIKMTGGNIDNKGCIGAIVSLCGPTFIILVFIIFEPIERDSLAATWISFGAALVQVFSQLLPFLSFYLLRYPPATAPAQHADTKKLIIYSRSCNLIVCVYWAMYCVFTYKHDFFEFANVVGAVFALISFALHLFYALEPQAAGRTEKKQRAGAMRHIPLVQLVSGFSGLIDRDMI